MSLLAECGVPLDAAIVDVGSGASVFLDNCQAYRTSLRRATHQGSWIIFGVFSESGPTSCAGLPVHRSSPAEISAFLSSDFVVKRSVAQRG